MPPFEPNPSSPMSPSSNKGSRVSPKLRMSSGESRSSRRRRYKSSSTQKHKPLSPERAIQLMERALEDNSSRDEREETDVEFSDHLEFSHRAKKSLYFANQLPVTSRPSLPLTMLAVSQFTKGSYLSQFDCLEFLDLEMASEIGRNACVTPTVLIMALLYLERLSNSNPHYLHTVNPSELFVISLLVASKFIQDTGEDGVYNDEWATSARMDLKRINSLEIDFLSAINWNLNVDLKDFNRILDKIESSLAQNEGMKRGWWTYNEIHSLSNAMTTWSWVWPIISEYFIKVMAVAALSYSTLLATIFSSTFLAQYLFITSKHLLSTPPTSSTCTNLGLDHTGACGTGDLYENGTILHSSHIPSLYNGHSQAEEELMDQLGLEFDFELNLKENDTMKNGLILKESNGTQFFLYNWPRKRGFCLNSEPTPLPSLKTRTNYKEPHYPGTSNRHFSISNEYHPGKIYL